MIKKLLILSTAATCIGGGAFAADLRGPILPETPATYGVLPVAGFTWGGFYVGANVGYGGGESHYRYDTSVEKADPCGCIYFSKYSGGDSHRSNGVIGGVQAGYNYAFANNIVFGVEADFDGTDISDSGILSDLAYRGDATVNVHSRLDYLGTARGRLGYAFDRLLVYGTGGFAYGQVSSSLSAPYVNPPYGLYDGHSSFHTGYAYGGGFEFAVTNNLLFRAEYLRAELGSKGFGYSTDENVSYNARVRQSYNIVRAGLDYKFDVVAPIAPVIARY